MTNRTKGNKMSKIANKLVAMGGTAWESNGKSRVYLNNWLELAGVSVTRYGTGNVSGASLDGKKISNAKASELGNVKVFWDCNSDELICQGEARMLDDIIPNLKAAIGV